MLTKLLQKFSAPIQNSQYPGDVTSRYCLKW